MIVWYGIYVVYDHDKPITICYCYISGSIPSFYVGLVLLSMQKQTDFLPVALRRQKIPSAKPSRKMTSLTSQTLFQQWPIRNHERIEKWYTSTLGFDKAWEKLREKNVHTKKLVYSVRTLFRWSVWEKSTWSWCFIQKATGVDVAGKPTAESHNQ